MTRMIPPYYDPDSTPSPGERELFERLRDDPATEGWIALHSLGIARHPRQIQGEADFVVIVPGHGIVVIEVKAYRRVERLSDGLWKLGSKQPTVRSPFIQADEAMHAVKKQLRNSAAGLPPVPIASAVAFTHTRFAPPDCGEWHSWQYFDATDFHRRPVSALVLGILRNHRAHLAASGSARGWFRPDAAEPSKDDAKRIAEHLRPAFDFTESPKIQRYRRKDEVARFTEEQFQLLDMIAGNPRCTVKGAAGTGKTFIALEAARRLAAEGRQVLLCCYNKLLGQWLREETVTAPGITAGTLHSYLAALAGQDGGRQGARPHDYFERELPDRALEALLDRELPPFDALVVDEAQDLMLDAYLDVFDTAVGSGLAGGQWLFFGDFTNQAIYDSSGDGLHLLLDRTMSSATFHLAKNCRNVPAVAQYVETSSRLDPGYAGYLRPENDRETVQRLWSTRDEQVGLLEEHLQRLLSDGFDADEIVVLSPLRTGSAAEGLRGTPRWASRLAPADCAAGNQIPYATIHGFKGMDAPAAIVTDFERIASPKEESLFYIASSRARDDLTVLAARTARPDLRRLVLGE
ncbi:NERD domain-containing protein [Streptomyces sp. 7N604]|uniref:NERD domain-containing protein n=1 Tax=Streptomyces sp. 7N604 TaxID=3457415 RepID=UPI003FD65C8F